MNEKTKLKLVKDIEEIIEAHPDYDSMKAIEQLMDNLVYQDKELCHGCYDSKCNGCFSLS
jgi:NAD-dependent dihydropyrimidine dehydrogenase PreA subunit